MRPIDWKTLDWKILAHCDAYAVKRTVEKADRVAETVVRPMSMRNFQEKLSSDALWKSVYDTLTRSYADLEGKFELQFDNYGGYKLVYIGEKTITGPFVIRNCPVGFVALFPDKISDLSVMTSRKTNNQLLLLGPMRFVNSDCSPNCEYDFSNDRGVVELRVKTRLKKGDEVLVTYGPDFFESHKCLCRSRTCQSSLPEADNLLTAEQTTESSQFDNNPIEAESIDNDVSSSESETDLNSAGIEGNYLCESDCDEVIVADSDVLDNNTNSVGTFM